jgi:hypothetical protein
VNIGSLLGSVYSRARSLNTVVRGHEVVELVQSYAEYRFRPMEGMSL